MCCCFCFLGTEYGILFPNSTSTAHILLSSLNPLDSRKWRRKPWSWRAFKVIKVGLYVCVSPKCEIKSISGAKLQGLRYSTIVNGVALVFSTRQIPIEVLLLLCIPVVDPDKEDKNWRRPLNCLQLVTAPIACVFAFQSGQCEFATLKQNSEKHIATQKKLVSCFLLHLDANYMIQGQFPLWLLFFLVGLFLSAIVFFTTTNDSPPRYHPVGICNDLNNTYAQLKNHT